MNIRQHIYFDANTDSAGVLTLEGEAALLQQEASNGVVLLANAAGQTLTTAQILGDTLLRSGAAAVSDTTPTAAAIVAAVNALTPTGRIPADTTMAFDWFVRNTNSGTLTIVAGSGVTLEGTTTVAANFARKYLVRLTNVTLGSEAVTISGIFTAAV